MVKLSQLFGERSMFDWRKGLAALFASRPQEPSQACAARLLDIAKRGGWIDNDDDLTGPAELIEEARNLGWLTGGGRWSVGFRLTKKGWRALKLQAPTPRPIWAKGSYDQDRRASRVGTGRSSLTT